MFKYTNVSVFTGGTFFSWIYIIYQHSLKLGGTKYNFKWEKVSDIVQCWNGYRWHVSIVWTERNIWDLSTISRYIVVCNAFYKMVEFNLTVKRG